MDDCLNTGWAISQKTLRSFARVDNMSPDLRACVHEFGEPIVSACLHYGVTNPRHIRDLVREIWEGARQQNQRRPVLGTLDWLLHQNNAGFGAKTLVRILRNSNHYIVPHHPSAPMVNASMMTCSDFSMRVTKQEKHRLRLMAAISAGIAHIWPDLK